jgi:hypothetical protein
MRNVNVILRRIYKRGFCYSIRFMRVWLQIPEKYKYGDPNFLKVNIKYRHNKEVLYADFEPVETQQNFAQRVIGQTICT